MKRIAIITGGAQGIGKITALHFINENIVPVLFDIDQEALNETQNELLIKGELLSIKGDVSKEKDVRNCINQVLKKYDRIDILVNNAAIAINKKITELTLEEWDKVVSVNLTGAFLFSKYAANSLKKTHGNIINICSTRAFMSEADTEAYSASKGGIYALTHALAISLGPEIRVNSISPGWIEVGHIKKEKNKKTYPLSQQDHQQHPCGRVGEADDIARMAVFLCDNKNSFITGQNFIIDGGMTRKMIYV
ncbi:MAG: SDR family oxidoreductase [Bacteroidales bacterium]|nr:SDR family oxidoreductase [Bacteroidales bacterium]